MGEIEKNFWPGWETVGLIGRGSFGTVYEIQRDVFGDIEKAALKVISIPQNVSDIEEMYSDGYDDESITSAFKSHLQSIVAEYSLMRKMNGNTNIVNCDDIRYIQHDDGVGWDIFIKMELLTPMLKALPNPIPVAAIIKVAKDMCAALELCRQHGIIHRDIKPQNIFVSPYGEYKLGDFGIAKTVERTMGGTKIGTYKYMAPEVFNNKPYGIGADIYSLGLVLYWMLNERRMPFMPLPPVKPTVGQESESRNRRFSGEKLPEPAHGSAELKRIVLKACAYDPKDRYLSAAEMLEDLNGLDSNGELLPPPPVPDPEPPEPTPDNDGPDPEPLKPTPDNDGPDPEPPKKKKSFLKYILIGAGIITLLIIFLLVRSCGRDKTPEKPSLDMNAAIENAAVENAAVENEVTANVDAGSSEAKTALATPTNLEAVVEGTNNIRLTWKRVEGAAGYAVYFATSGNTYREIALVTKSDYLHQQLVAGKTYYYKVAAYRMENGEKVYGDRSLEVSASTKLSAPHNLNGKYAGNGKIKLTWDKVSNVDGYAIYRSTSENGEYKFVDRTTDLSFTDSGLTKGKTYYYKMRAFELVDGEREYGSYSSVVSAIAQPIVPGGVTFTTIEDTGHPNLTWIGIDTAEGYEVWRAEGKNGKFKKMFETVNTSYTNTSVVVGKTYCYKVRAIYSSGEASSFSEANYIVAACPAPDVQSSLDNKTGKPKLKWEKVDGASKYEIYRAASENGEYKKLETTGKMEFTDSSAKKDATYYYKVKALCSKTSAGDSAFSEIKTIKSN